MKKMLFSLALVLCFGFVKVYAQRIEIKPTLLTTLQIGKKTGEYALAPGDAEATWWGPGTPFFTPEGNLAVFDQSRNRLKIYTLSGKLLEDRLLPPMQLPPSVGGMTAAYCIKSDGNRMLVYAVNGASYIVSTDGRVGRFYFPSNLMIIEKYFIGEALFGWSYKGKLFCIPAPNYSDDIEDIPVVHDEKSIRELIAKGDARLAGIALDPDGLLRVDGSPFLGSSWQLVKWYRRGNPSYSQDARHIVAFPGNEEYLNTDKDGNRYFLINMAILVMGTDGYVKTLVLPKTDKRIEYSGCPAIHPSGDIYFVGFENTAPPKNFGLYKIKRTW